MALKDISKICWIFLSLGFAMLAPTLVIIAASGFLKDNINDTINAQFTPICNTFSILLLLALQKYRSIISLPKQLFLFEFIGIFVLVTLPPIVVSTIDISIKYYYCLFCFALTGILSGLGNNAIFTLGGYFGGEEEKPNVKANTGLCFSGIICALFNIFFLNQGISQNKSAYIFFYVFAGLIFIVFILTIYLFRIKDFVDVLKKQGVYGNVEDEKAEKLENSEEITEKKDKKEVSVMELYKKILPALLGILVTFSISWTAFPTLLIQPKQNDKSFGIYVNFILLIYYISDALGKEFGGKINVSTKSALTFIFLRTVLLAPIFLNIFAEDKKLYAATLIEVLFYFNPFILGITNGIGTSICFCLPDKLVEDNEKGRAGSAVSLFLCFGTSFGSWASLFLFKFIN